MTTEKMDLESLKKAVLSLKEVLAEPKTVIVRDATIQRFEYTFELCWKSIKRYLETQTLESQVDHLNKKDLFRIASEQGLVRDAVAWFDYLKARNETVHTYNASKAEQVYAIAKDFFPEAEFLLKTLESRNA